jgi:8-amino-7-oxononanoate synthase
MTESALSKKLAAALASREDRNSRNRLPDSSLAHTPSTPGGTPHVPPVDFSSNDYLSLSTSPLLRARFLAALYAAPAILGSGGSRVVVYNHAHAELEARLARTFRSPAALLFNSGFNANACFFTCVPQPGDALLYDDDIHASVHDGVRASRIAQRMRRPFTHNDVSALHAALWALRNECAALKEGKSSVFVAVESVYSMDGAVAPLSAMLDTMDEVFPAGNAHLLVDEAHATGLYGPGGRGVVALLGLEDRVLARFHSFGKALAATGGEFLSTCQYELYLTGTHSRVVHEHFDSRLFAQLCAPINIHHISHQCCYHRCLVFLRPPRGRHC